MKERVSKEIENVEYILDELEELIHNIHYQDVTLDAIGKSKHNIKLLKLWVKGVGKRLNKIPDKKHFY
jgi:fructoselysine-6-P-deglycase FrlB-like protein